MVEIGETLNQRPPRFQLEILVPHAGGFSYRVTTQALCNMARERVLRAGPEVYVRVNPGVPHRIEIDWEKTAEHHGVEYRVAGGWGG